MAAGVTIWAAWAEVVVAVAGVGLGLGLGGRMWREGGLAGRRVVAVEAFYGRGAELAPGKGPEGLRC